MDRTGAEGEFLVVEEQPSRGGAVPHAGANGQVILARRRRRQRARPAHRVLLVANRRDNGGVFHSHVEIGARLGPAELRLSLEVGIVEVLGQQLRARCRPAAPEMSREPRRECWPYRSRRARTALAQSGTAARFPPAESPAWTRCRYNFPAAQSGRRRKGR